MKALDLGSRRIATGGRAVLGILPLWTGLACSVHVDPQPPAEETPDFVACRVEVANCLKPPSLDDAGVVPSLLKRRNLVVNQREHGREFFLLLGVELCRVDKLDKFGVILPELDQLGVSGRLAGIGVGLAQQTSIHHL